METIYDVLTAIEKIGTVTDLEIEQNDDCINEENDFSKGLTITIKDMSYKFVGTKFDILKNINLDISAGEKVCFVGYDGSGKSMLFKVISGYYNDFSGSVLINNIPYTNFNNDKIRSMVSYSLSKEDAIFNATLAENISLGRESVKFEDVKYSADLFGLSNFREVFPNGYNTVLNPEGKRLPKSISIKIILARTLASKPKVLILENILSKLKTFDKEAFLNHIFDNKQMTVLFDSSDESIAMRCDKIVRMESGAVIDVGTYDEMKNMDWFQNCFTSK